MGERRLHGTCMPPDAQNLEDRPIDGVLFVDGAGSLAAPVTGCMSCRERSLIAMWALTWAYRERTGAVVVGSGDGHRYPSSRGVRSARGGGFLNRLTRVLRSPNLLFAPERGGRRAIARSGGSRTGSSRSKHCESGVGWSG
jgi:hypothetical protein